MISAHCEEEQDRKKALGKQGQPPGLLLISALHLSNPFRHSENVVVIETFSSPTWTPLIALLGCEQCPETQK